MMQFTEVEIHLEIKAMLKIIQAAVEIKHANIVVRATRGNCSAYGKKC